MLQVLLCSRGVPTAAGAAPPRALDRSEVAWLASAETGRLVAFGRAEGDGVFNIMVEPSYQSLVLGQIGRAHV